MRAHGLLKKKYDQFFFMQNSLRGKLENVVKTKIYSGNYRARRELPL